MSKSGFIGSVKLLAIIVFAVGAVVGCSKANENEVVFAVDSTWPPFEFLNEEKEIVGFTIDMVKAIGKEEGFTPTFVTTAWDGIFAGLVNGNYDAISSSVTITEERKEIMDFSDSYYDAGQLLVMRKETAKGITSLDDLIRKHPKAQVGAQLGTQGSFLVEDKYPNNVKNYAEIGPAVEELANATIEGIVADAPLIVGFLLKNDAYKEAFTTVGEEMTEETYGLVVKKGNKELLEKLNRGLKTIKDKGIYEKVLRKWTK